MKVKRLLVTLLALFFLAPVHAGQKIAPGVTCYRLDNGLTLFVAEKHTVPLVYIEIAVRAGAVTQSEKSAGIFHLYEHMMFKGNSLYKDEAAVQKALSDLGVASWNGTTGVQCVNYFFTIPSAKLKDGLEFWNAAIREPLMDEAEFETEKKVVVSEINGTVKNPGRILTSYFSKTLFPDAPWQLDPSGSEESVMSATVDELREMQARYYVPDNAALFVGGDVNPGEVFRLVNSIYGSWKKGSGSYDADSVFQNPAPFDEPRLCVMPYEKLSGDYAQVSVRFRGPDSDVDIDSTYAADLLGFYLDNPSSSYKQMAVNNPVFKIPAEDYLWENYGTHRRIGVVEFGAVMLSPEEDMAGRAKEFLSFIQKNVVEDTFLSAREIIPKKDLAVILQHQKDSRMLETETANGILSSLRFWWTDAGVDYYLSYPKKLGKVKTKDIKDFLKKYVAGKNPVVMVLINPALYEAQKEEFTKAGFTEVKEENAFWWSR